MPSKTRTRKSRKYQKRTRKQRRQKAGAGNCPAKCPYGNGTHEWGEWVELSMPGGTAMRRYCNKCNCNELNYLPKRMA